MLLSSAMSVNGHLLLQLCAAAVRTTVLAALAGALIKILDLKPPSARLYIWKIVIAAGLGMPLLVLLVPAVDLPVPHSAAQLRSAPATPAGKLASPATVARTFRRAALHTDDPSANREAPGSMTSRARFVRLLQAAESNSWQITSSLYAFGVLIFMTRLFIGLVVARRLVRRSTSLEDAHHMAPLTAMRQARGVQVRESSSIFVPITVGAFKPTVLLPATWRQWTDARLAAVLAHEISHVARRDPLWQFISLLHRAIFWFSPLSWWLNGHIAELAEEASDEAALSAGAKREQYATDLLGFFEDLQRACYRVRWQGVAMANPGARRAEKRLDKILAWRGDAKMFTKKWVVMCAIAIAMPAAYLIAAARPTEPNRPSASLKVDEQATPSSPANSAQPAGPQAPAEPGASPDGVTTNATPAQPNSPATPQSPAEPTSATAVSESSTSNHRDRYFYSYGFDDSQRFVIVSGKTDAFTMSGTGEDARHVENLKKKITGDFIWFQRDEKSYIIRDQATVNRARQLWAPQEELGKQQEALGKQQEALGKQQEELSARMQQVRVQVPDISAELDKLKAELKDLGPNASMEQIGRIQSEIGELQSRIGEIQSHAGDQQGKIGDEMGALGEKQGKLGEQQGELGRRQGELAEKANREMKKLLDDAIKNGTAQPESSVSGSGTL